MTQAQPLIQTLPMTLGAPMSDDPGNPATIEIPLQIELPNGQTLFAAVALGGLPFDGQRQIAERMAAAWNAFAGIPTQEIKAHSKCLHQIAEPATVQAAPSEVMGALRALHDSVELAIQPGALSARALEIIIMQPATDVLMRAAAVHPDDAAVDALAALMKAKLAKQRAKGYGGWDDKAMCSHEFLSALLRRHVDKGDPVDVANFCAFLLARGEGIAAAPQAVQAAVPVDVVTDLKNALADATEIRQQLRLMEEHARGDVWRWQADAANELATMGSRMSVLILASDLRNLLAAPAHPAEGVPAQDEAFGAGVDACIDKLNELNHQLPWSLKQSEALSEAIAALEALATTHTTLQGLDAHTCVTADGVAVNPGQEVWVFGSCGLAAAEVDKPVTNYLLFSNPIPVSKSYSSKEAALTAQAKQGGAA